MGSCDRSGQQGSESASEEISPGTRLLDSWPREGPELLWIYEGLGKGYGSPLISKEGIFINGEEDGNSYTICLDHNGSFRWRSPNGKEFMGMDYSSSYPGTRSTPTLMGQLVYAASGTGHLSCFDTRNGKIIWPFNPLISVFPFHGATSNCISEIKVSLSRCDISIPI